MQHKVLFMEKNELLQDISSIRKLMERSSRFISLSGLSGIIPGILALITVGAIYYKVWPSEEMTLSHKLNVYRYVTIDGELLVYVAVLLGCLFICSIISGIYFTARRTKQMNLTIWDHTSKQLLISLMIPIGVGCLFCLALFMNGLWGLVLPASLLFYGLALLNASKYTLVDIQYLAYSELVLGLIACYFYGYSLVFWGVGFGLLHIIYGAVMYYKYEK